MKGVKLITGNKHDRFPEINFKSVVYSCIYEQNSSSSISVPTKKLQVDQQSI